MVEILRGWLLGLVAAALILHGTAGGSCRKGSIRPMARVIGGARALLVALRPRRGSAAGRARAL